MSKELEALKRLRHETIPATYMLHFDKNECCDIIEQALLKAQEQEKVLEIIKKHLNFEFYDDDDMLLVSVQSKQDEDTWDTTTSANIQFLSVKPLIYNENAKEEFEILKEIFEGSKNNG